MRNYLYVKVGGGKVNQGYSQIRPWHLTNLVRLLTQQI